MALSPTTKESDFKNSIKKYFLDNLETTESLKVFFEELEEVPLDVSGNPYNKWVIIVFGRRDLGAVSAQQISIDMYTREDREGDDLAALSDTIMNYIIDENSTNGLVSIPFYDTSGTWAQVGGIIPYLQPSLGSMESEDGVQFKAINLLCKWGGK